MPRASDYTQWAIWQLFFFSFSGDIGWCLNFKITLDRDEFSACQGLPVLIGLRNIALEICNVCTQGLTVIVSTRTERSLQNATVLYWITTCLVNWASTTSQSVMRALFQRTNVDLSYWFPQNMIAPRLDSRRMKLLGMSWHRLSWNSIRLHYIMHAFDYLVYIYSIYIFLIDILPWYSVGLIQYHRTWWFSTHLVVRQIEVEVEAATDSQDCRALKPVFQIYEALAPSVPPDPHTFEAGGKPKLSKSNKDPKRIILRIYFDIFWCCPLRFEERFPLSVGSAWPPPVWWHLVNIGGEPFATWRPETSSTSLNIYQYLQVSTSTISFVINTSCYISLLLISCWKKIACRNKRV